MDLTLMDAAWLQAKTRVKSRDENLAAKAELAELFPDASASQIHRAFAEALALEKACYDIGDACRAEILTREEAEAQMEALFPGFSAEIYSQAVSYGLFISR